MTRRPDDRDLLVTTHRLPRYAMTEAEAARFLGLSRYAFRRNVLPHCRRVTVAGGRPTIVSVADLTRWFDEHAVRQEHRR